MIGMHAKTDKTSANTSPLRFSTSMLANALRVTAFAGIMFAATMPMVAQDWIRTTIANGAEKIRIAAAPVKPLGGDPQLKVTFDTTLQSDLAQAGIFDVVSKSMEPNATPGTPQEINLAQWGQQPTNAAMVAFGSIGVQGQQLQVKAWLFDAKNANAAQVLGKQYTDTPTIESARLIAHKFADEIILRLGAGVPGIAESHVYFVHAEHGMKEIWVMDYDGENAHPVTHLGAISLSPRISPDGSRLAFASLDKNGWNIKMYSLLLNRMVNFSNLGGTNISPAWAPNGNELAFSSSSTGDPEIWASDGNGGARHRLTNFRGPDIAPVWNPKSGNQIAWISGRTGLPQLYMMDADGTNVSRLTQGGYATSPSWSPNGQLLAYSWNRQYGPGAPGGTDIYVMEIAGGRWLQATHDMGMCDFPTWSPDDRHIMFQCSSDGKDIHSELWTMLADGSERHKVTSGGGNTMPNWSWH
jgi:TolB protein